MNRDHEIDPSQWVAYNCTICNDNAINRVTEACTAYRECRTCFDPQLCHGVSDD